MSIGQDTDGTPREKRWAVIAEDGRHSWLGRHSDPSEAELEEARRHLEATGVTAWLAVTEGVYYKPEHQMTVVMVRPLSGTGGGDFDQAVRLFLEERQRKLDATD